MSKKITKEEYENRFYQAHPSEQIEILEFTAISKPVKLRCLRCGKEHSRANGNSFISGFTCCEKPSETKYEMIKRRFEQHPDFELIKKLNKDYVIVKHNVCGNEYKRPIQSTSGVIDACPYCKTFKQRNMLSVNEVQETLDKLFDGSIKILDYKGQTKEKSHYRCLKCGLIFTAKHICMIQSRGCPKCDRFKSMGEKKMAAYLKEKGILFKEQVAVDELPLQHFDFCVYDKNDNIMAYIEVQGEQHFKDNGLFDAFEIQIERDNKKRAYCERKGIPLLEIAWLKGKFKNLDIIDEFFGSTTILNEEQVISE